VVVGIWLDNCASYSKGEFEVFAGEMRASRGVKEAKKGCDSVLQSVFPTQGLAAQLLKKAVADYCDGLDQFIPWWATTIAPDIRVSAISPGGTSETIQKAFVQGYEAKFALGRMATQDDLRQWGNVTESGGDSSVW